MNGKKKKETMSYDLVEVRRPGLSFSGPVSLNKPFIFGLVLVPVITGTVLMDVLM